jgi:hypothetical protein
MKTKIYILIFAFFFIIAVHKLHFAQQQALSIQSIAEIEKNTKKNS